MTSVPLPNLDDRRWADLVEEGRALIPFHAPEWTDHNVHDPGITVLELFAWVAEMDLYRVNRITDAHRRKFLALAGITPAPPRSATTILGLGLAPGTPPTPLPAGLEFTGNDPYGVPVRVRARHGLTVQPGRLATVLATGARDEDPRDLTPAWSHGEPIQPFGPDPGPGAALYLGFDLPAPWPMGTPLSLGFALAGGRSGVDERAAFAAEAAAHVASRVRPWDVLSCSQPTTPLAGAGLVHHDVVLRWELRLAPQIWLPLPADAVDDGTRALTLDGRMVVRVPAPASAGLVGAHPEDRTWLRLRLVRGGYDAVPILAGLTDNAVQVEQAVPAVVRLRLAPNVHVDGTPPVPGELTALDAVLGQSNEVLHLKFGPVTPARPTVRLLALDLPKQQLTIEAAALIRGTGGPEQQVVVPGAPLVAAGVSVAGFEDGRWRGWTPRPDFDASTRSDAHVVVDPSTGAVRFGDGEHGRVPPAGATVLITADLTRAQDGNVTAGAITALADTPHNRAVVPELAELTAQLARITNIVPAIGGTAAETVPSAIARARDRHRQAGRAVTLDDYAELARQTPGVRLARVEARANLHPGFGCQRAPGVVTVIVLPHLPVDRPTPRPGLRRAVAAYLDRRRVIGTRIEVTGPQYVRVTVRAAVRAVAGNGTDELADAVRAALNRFLHPLVGGPDATGWPFGRDVYRSEMLAVIDEVQGVEHVDALELISGDGTVSCGNVCVGPLGLVDAGPHEIDVR
ncbi:putative baseplate assembly protein (plasmid) [Rhodococcus sp. WB1]|uniref:putative baseplate assembly protein n=1 Tax=Rhodococcus sp. WB1 TaxID=1033922 RepID=UPI00081A4113|nr:putative baseplate assembly protein [Rhodococcus sp. WB1]ANZ28484.1 putative baseplate assembly protein [Rhodococcus sp. WB1]